MQKHQRTIVKHIKGMGHRVRIDNSAHGHPMLHVTLPDGREGKFPLSSSPREGTQALKNAVRQIRAWERSGEESPRKSTW